VEQTGSATRAALRPCACVGPVLQSAGKCVGGQSHTSYLAAQASRCPLVVVEKEMAQLMSASCAGLVAPRVARSVRNATGPCQHQKGINKRETTYLPSPWPLGMASSGRRRQSVRCGKLAATGLAKRARATRWSKQESEDKTWQGGRCRTAGVLKQHPHIPIR
jgi:hypothetical protein